MSKMPKNPNAREISNRDRAQTTKHFYVPFLLLFHLILISGKGHAYEFYKDTHKKQVAKDAKRWSLSDWMEQKKNSQLMDTWLMFNAPSPYEFFFGLDTATYKSKQTQNAVSSETSFRNYRASIGAFASIVGLYGEYESSDEETTQWKALLMLRLLGSSDQSTNLTVHYGLLEKTFTDPSVDDTWNHQLAGGRMTFYILKSFALQAQYDYLMEAESRNSNVRSRGTILRAGAHIEYGALRFYGHWYQEALTLDTLPNVTERQAEGIQFGARIYF